MWPRFGIKIGNSTLCIASTKSDGKVEVIANKQGDRVSQACLIAEDNEIECGLTAKQKMHSKPKQTVYNSFQLFLPKDFLTEEKIEFASNEIPCAYDAEANQFELKPASNDSKRDNVTKLSPYSVCVHLFKAEFELARHALSDSEAAPSAVLSIPNYYPLESWPELASAAEEAGFQVAQIISEPSAAVLAYALGEDSLDSDTKYVLCIKSGGLFSDFTLYEIFKGLYSIINSAGPFNIGGKQYTEVLIEFIADEFYKKYKLDPKESRRSMAKIKVAAEQCKHILTTLPSTQIYIDSLMDGVDFSMQMSRARYESLLQPVITKFSLILDEFVDTFVKDHEIHEIVILGGTMQIPKLQSTISSRFPKAKLNTSYAADEVVAIGCARQVSFIKDPKNQDLESKKTILCSNADLTIWHGNNQANAKIIISKGTILPSVVSVIVPSWSENKTDDSFHIQVNDKIEKFHIKGITPNENDEFKIEADVSVDHENNNTPVISFRCL